MNRGSSKETSMDEPKKETILDSHSTCIAHITPKDSVFDQLKDRNFSVATERLGTMASSMRDFYRSKPSPERADISEVKDFVRNLTSIKAEQEAISFHTELASEISKRTFESYSFKQKYHIERQLLETSVEKSHVHYLLGCIARQEPLPNLLRLICLWSLTNDGMEGDTFDLLMREILSTYGVGTIVLLQNLEQAGLLVRAKDPAIFSALGKRFSPPKVATWTVCRTALRLLVDYQPKESISDIEEAEAFSGYIPLSARVIQGALDDNAWKKLLSTLCTVFKNGHSAFEEDILHERYQVSIEMKNRKPLFDAVVVMIGGITRAEAAAMKALAYSSGKRIVIVSTTVFNGNGWIESMVDESEKWPL
ncbi:Vacuolar protein-sorting-associated protein 33 [Galdieria sulphuraria]|nr:Vacuolar protein-sorting-associated protein 33 [Galdieria sulphuraria]